MSLFAFGHWRESYTLVCAVAVLSWFWPFSTSNGGALVTVSDSELVKSLDRRIHQENAVLTLSEYGTAITAVFGGKQEKGQADEIVDLIFVSLLRDVEAKRHAVGTQFFSQCEEVIASSSQSSAVRRLAVMLQVTRFDDPDGGTDRETEWWKRMANVDGETQKFCLLALSIVPWSHEKSIALREVGLAHWFGRAQTDELRKGIVGCISSTVAAHKCDPVTGIRVYKYLVAVSNVSPELVQVMLSQIEVWVGELQLRLIFKVDSPSEVPKE